MPQKIPHGVEGDDLDYDLMVVAELQGPRVEPQEEQILDTNENVHGTTTP
jgi:hypothetical protein